MGWWLFWLGTAAVQAAPWAGHDEVVLYADFAGPYAAKAAGNPYPVGTHYELSDGVWRGTSKDGYLAYHGLRNVPPEAGTVTLRVRATEPALWRDGRRHTFAALPRTVEGMTTQPERWPREGLALSLRKTESNRLELLAHRGGDSWMRSSGCLPLLSVDTTTWSAESWHELAFSWDAGARKLWLVADGAAQEAAWPAGIDRPHEYLALVLGNTEDYLLANQEPAGAALDDLAVWSVPWPRVERLRAEAKPLATAPPPVPSRRARATQFGDDPSLARLEEAARRHLDLLVENQRHGGWCLAIKWPSLLQYTAKFRLPEPGNLIWLSKDSHTAFGAAQLLYAWQCLGEDRYLAAARRTGEMYLATQHPQDGYWMNSYAYENGGYVSTDRYVLLQDHTQTGPLFLLTYLWRVTSDERYLAAARKSADFLLKAQNPNGSWAHHWDQTRQVGISSTGEAGGGEVNDYGTSGPVAALLDFAAVTGDARYVAPALRGADWLLTAFVENPRVVGWGAQYDAANRLIPARHFEPASITNYAPRWAAVGLLAAYRQTRDERYLIPLRKTLAWFDANRGEGGWWWDHDPDSGRPIAMWMRRIYHLDDPAEVAAYEAATGGRKPERGDWVNVASLRSELEAVVKQPEGRIEPPPTRNSLARYIAAMGPSYVASYLEGGVPPAIHPQAGLWLWDSDSGLSTNLVRHQVVRFCDLLLRARAARGDIPLDHPLLRRIEAGVGWTRILPLPQDAPAQ